MKLAECRYTIKNWENEKLYPSPGKLTWKLWAWEFLRRNPEYQNCWDDKDQNPGVAEKQFRVKSFCNPLKDNPKKI